MPTRAPVAGFLRRPPADTKVLFGYVRGRRHLEWIHSTGLYNLRATGSRGRVGLRSSELSAEFVLLYGHRIVPEIWQVRGLPELHSRDEMERLGYPRPRGQAYYCLPIRAIDTGQWAERLT